MRQTLARSVDLFGKFIASAPPLFLDIGSSTTRIAVANKLVIEEPTCVVLHMPTQSVVSIGEQAMSLVGKTPESLSVFFPIQYGVVAHPMALTLFMKSLQQKIADTPTAKQLLVGRSGLQAIPADSSLVERGYFASVMQQLQLGAVKQVSQAEAIFAHRLPKASLSDSFMVLDIGGQTTQASFFSGNELLLSKRLRWGGVQFTETVQELIKQEHQCGIGWHSAEKVKLTLGSVPVDGRRSAARKGAVRGKDVITHLSKTVVLSSEMFHARFSQLFDDLIERLEMVFFGVPAEVLTSALDQGILLTGGGSQLEGLALALSSKLHCQVHVSKTPQHDSIDGLIDISGNSTKL